MNSAIFFLSGLFIGVFLLGYGTAVIMTEDCPICEDCSIRPAGTIKIVENHTICEKDTIEDAKTLLVEAKDLQRFVEAIDENTNSKNR